MSDPTYSPPAPSRRKSSQVWQWPPSAQSFRVDYSIASPRGPGRGLAARDSFRAGQARISPGLVTLSKRAVTAVHGAVAVLRKLRAPPSYTTNLDVTHHVHRRDQFPPGPAMLRERDEI